MTTIGLISYSRPPREKIPPARLRALLAEAALQGARLTLIDGSTCDPVEDAVDAEVWAGTGDGAGWVRTRTGGPDVAVLIEGAFGKTASFGAAETLLRGRPHIADAELDKLSLLYALSASGPYAASAIPSLAVPADRIGETLTSALRRFGDAVVKPVDGRNGVGLYFLHGEGDGWVVRRGDGGEEGRGTAAEAAAYVEKRIAGRIGYRRYLVQRYIESRAEDGRAVDIRVHVQRRADGEWGVTRAYVRLGEARSSLANTSRGGYQGSLRGFLERRRRRAAEIAAEIEATALAAARSADAAMSLPLSEAGVDLAIDPDDKLWIIEVNAQPGTSLHEHARAEHFIGYALAVAQGRAGAERTTVPAVASVQADG